MSNVAEVEHAQPARIVINVDPDMPWAQWAQPDVRSGPIKNLHVSADDSGALQVGRRIIEQIEESDEQRETIEQLGFMSDHGFKEFGWAGKFPANFVQKLSPELQAAIINERIQRVRDKEITLVFEHGRMASMLPAWRGIVPYAATAQVVWDKLSQAFGQDHLEIAHTFCGSGNMHCRFMTPIREKVTAKKDDILHVGIELRQRYGTTISMCLYTQRLACLNGMTANESEFGWTRRTEGAPSVQLAWLAGEVERLVPKYEELVNRSRVMANTKFSGNPEEVLREHARAMRLPRRHYEALIEAFREEPGDTEWDMLNAFTRMATHGNLPDRTRRAVMLASGNWAQDFEMVSCRLPRPLAERLGAELLEEAREAMAEEAE